MHPASTLQLLPVPRAMAQTGVHVLCAGQPLRQQRHAADLRERRRSTSAPRSATRRKSGATTRSCSAAGRAAASLSIFYQAEAEQPTITATPAGDAVDLKAGASLIAADAMIFQAAHRFAAQLLAETGSIRRCIDEDDPDRRDLELDIYDPQCPNQPPYTKPSSSAGIARASSRACGGATAWVKEMLARAARGEQRDRARLRHPPHDGRAALHRSRRSSPTAVGRG